MKTRKDCVHFLGFGDWNLCCKIKPDLRDEDAPVCDDFEKSNSYDDLKFAWKKCKQELEHTMPFQRILKFAHWLLHKINSLIQRRAS